MIIERKVDSWYEDTMYYYNIQTDSSIERDILEKHLVQAQEEYKTWIRKFTKGENKNG